MRKHVAEHGTGERSLKQEIFVLCRPKNIEQVFDLEFQREAVRLVTEDNDGICFAKRDGQLVEPASAFPAAMLAAQGIIDHVDELSNFGWAQN